MDKDQYFNNLTASNGSPYFSHRASEDLIQNKKSSTRALNILNQLRGQIDDSISSSEDAALTQTIQLLEEIRDIQTLAASAAKRAEKQAEAKAKSELAEKRRKIEQRIFADQSNAQIIETINLLIEFTQDMNMKPRIFEHYSISENKDRIIDAIHYDEYEREFKFEAFEAFCEQKLSSASINNTLAAKEAVTNGEEVFAL